MSTNKLTNIIYIIDLIHLLLSVVQLLFLFASVALERNDSALRGELFFSSHYQFLMASAVTSLIACIVLAWLNLCIAKCDISQLRGAATVLAVCFVPLVFAFYYLLHSRSHIKELASATTHRSNISP